jgi:hypothetical protein
MFLNEISKEYLEDIAMQKDFFAFQKDLTKAIIQEVATNIYF